MSEITNKQNNDTIGIDVVLSVLESGHSVELPAYGYSMFPALKPGDRVTVMPLKKGELPEPGSLVVFKESGVLAIHRLLRIAEAGGSEMRFVTRGDSMKGNDEPWPRENLLGVAVSYKRELKAYPVKKFLPGIGRYKFNRILLWLGKRIPFL